MTNNQQQRQVSNRVFASELNESFLVEKRGDGDYDPRLQTLVSGKRTGRVVVVGTLTDVKEINDDGYLQATVHTGDGKLYAYAGQYQEEAQSTLQDLDAPTYVTMIGKPSAYELDNGGMNVSIKPETVQEVSEAEREQWVLEAANATLDRLEAFDPDDGEEAMATYEDIGQLHEQIRSGVEQAVESVFGEAETEAEEAGVEASADEEQDEIEDMGINELRMHVAEETEYTASGDYRELEQKARGTFDDSGQTAEA
jgi:RPA family protein